MNDFERIRKMMNEEERKAHMEKDAKAMKSFLRSVMVKVVLFLIAVGIGVFITMYGK